MTDPVVYSFDLLHCETDLGFNRVFIIYYISKSMQDEHVFIEIMICISAVLPVTVRIMFSSGSVKDSGSAVILIDSPLSKIVISWS